jgi:hypothetical protein
VGREEDPLHYYSDNDIIAFHTPNNETGGDAYILAKIVRMRAPDPSARNNSAKLYPVENVHVKNQHALFTLRFFEQVSEKHTRRFRYTLPPQPNNYTVQEWPAENIIMAVKLNRQAKYFTLDETDRVTLNKYLDGDIELAESDMKKQRSTPNIT